MLWDLLHAKLVWMSVCSIPNYYMQNWVFLYLVPFLLNWIGNWLAYVAALFVTSVFTVKLTQLMHFYLSNEPKKSDLFQST